MSAANCVLCYTSLCRGSATLLILNPQIGSPQERAEADGGECGGGLGLAISTSGGLGLKARENPAQAQDPRFFLLGARHWHSWCYSTGIASYSSKVGGARHSMLEMVTMCGLQSQMRNWVTDALRHVTLTVMFLFVPLGGV